MSCLYCGSEEHRDQDCTHSHGVMKVKKRKVKTAAPPIHPDDRSRTDMSQDPPTRVVWKRKRVRRHEEDWDDGATFARRQA